MPLKPPAYLFRNQSLADCRVRLVVPPGQDGQIKGACFELPGHSAILGMASPDRFARRALWQDPGPFILQEEVATHDDLEGAYHVIYTAYAHQLPDHVPLPVPLLMQMAHLAARWNMQKTLCMCLEAAAATAQLSVQDINCLLQDNLPVAITRHDQYEVVLQTCRHALHDLFNPAQEVQPLPLAEFCSLSVQAVRLWAGGNMFQLHRGKAAQAFLAEWLARNGRSLNDQQRSQMLSLLDFGGSNTVSSDSIAA